MTQEQTTPAGARTQPPQHTPGPWRIGSSVPALDGIGTAIEVDVDNHTIALVHPCEEMLENARVIAAAPKLLEACKRLKKLCEEHCDTRAQDYTGACMAAFTAIQKAQGNK